MDVRCLSGALLAIFLIGCAEKTTQRVFPEASQKPGSECAGQRIENQFIVDWEDGRSSVERASDSDALISQLVEPQIHLIKHVEFDKKIYLPKNLGSRDNLLNPEPSAPNWGEKRIQAEEAWAKGYKGEGVLVGVVDTVIDYTHPQLKTRLAGNEKELNGLQGVDDDENGVVDDFYGWDFSNNRAQTKTTSTNQTHGSHVSGIILADPDQGDIIGVAPQAKLIPSMFMKNDTEGGNLSDGIAAIKYASYRGAKVINASWGGSVCSQSLKQTMAAMANKGVLFVVAAGNEGADLDRVSFFPVNYLLPNQINVGASNEAERLTSFSNHSNVFVQLAAPGFDIWSTVPGGIQRESGTSMAAPFVTGAAAVLLSAKPDATFTQIRTALIQGVDSDRNWGMRVQSEGRLNVKKSLDYLLAH